MKKIFGLSMFVLLLLSACSGVNGDQAAGLEVAVYKEPG